MKTMTCKQLGGPCEAPFHGNKADEVIKAEDNHLKVMVAGGDETHKSALKSMQERIGGNIPYQAWGGISRQGRPLLLFPKTDPSGWIARHSAFVVLREERHVYNMKKSSAEKGESPSQLIGARIKELGDWRGKTLSRLRALIKQADPDVVEEWKWRKPSHPGVPVWSHQGPICTGETYKSVVKLTFFKGASLKDPSGLFNSSLEGNTRRAIDFHEDDEIDEKAFATLIRAAVSLNESSSR